MGGEMTKVVIHDGKLINIGPWDYCVSVETVAANPWTGEGDAPEDWDYAQHEIEVIGNPLPEGAAEVDREIVESAKGRLLLADDWYALREDAYPPLKDQLEAFWKGGEEAEAMAARIQAIRDQYPKPAQP